MNSEQSAIMHYSAIVQCKIIFGVYTVIRLESDNNKTWLKKLSISVDIALFV